MAAGVGGLALTGEASAYHGRFRTVVDVVDEGADDDGRESVSDLVEHLTDNNDSIGLYFPPGEYLFDEQVFTLDFDEIGLFANDATFVPVSGDQWNGESRIFKFGTSYAPGNWFEAHNLEFDFRGANTGLRAIQTQVNDLWVDAVSIRGHHNSGTLGPAHFDVVDPDEYGLVENFRVPGGGAYTATTPQDAYPTVGVGPTGIIVSPAHKGRIKFKDCVVGGFPDNGLYTSNDGGKIFVEGGTFRNSNVSNIRLAGDGSRIRDATIVVDHVRPRDRNQVGIRLDRGDDVLVADSEIRLQHPTGEGVHATDDLGSATLVNLDVTMDDDDGTLEAIEVDDGAGDVHMRGLDIEIRAGGQALQIEPYSGRGRAPTIVQNTRIRGGADGGRGGSHAIRLARDGSELWNLDVDQPGGDHRRALTVIGDDCLVAYGSYRSTHHPIVNHASGTAIDEIEARADNGYEAVKLYDGNADVGIYDSVLYNGFVDLGTADFEQYRNRFPDG